MAPNDGSSSSSCAADTAATGRHDDEQHQHQQEQQQQQQQQQQEQQTGEENTINNNILSIILNKTPFLSTGIDYLWGYCSACMHAVYTPFRCIGSSNYMYAGEITGGLFFGYAAGISLKKTIRAGLFAAGLSFLALQTLSYNGYLRKSPYELINNTININNININNINKLININKINNKINNIKNNINIQDVAPSTAGFSIGMAWALLR